MKRLPLMALIMVVSMTAGCSNQITEEDLIGGKWSATAAFENEEPGGEPVCGYYAKGLEFKDQETVYNEYRKKDFKYELREADEGKMKIYFYPSNGAYDYFEIYKVNENAFGMIGPYKDFVNSCYFERD